MYDNRYLRNKRYIKKISDYKSCNLRRGIIVGLTILIFNLFMFVIALFIAYRIILLAVREGINQSMIGDYFRKEHENQNNTEKFRQNNSVDD